MSQVFDTTPCQLGEGPLWHPGLGQLFWFDIPARTLLTRSGDQTISHGFEDMVSAAGWIDDTTLLVASATALLRVDLTTQAQEVLCPLEADRPQTRSNDGRADPWGGFWIGTMGRNAEPGAGAIYRYYRGELRRIAAPLTIPNAISFAPDGTFACYCDSTQKLILRQRLADADGWPLGAPDPYLDLRGLPAAPDGAVIDADGLFWNAQWGAGRIAAYDSTGALAHIVPLDARHTSCPAFGGQDLSTLFVTSAREGLSDDVLTSEPHNGMTFAIDGVGRGQPEHRVIL